MDHNGPAMITSSDSAPKREGKCGFDGYPYPCPYTKAEHGLGLPAGHRFTPAERPVEEKAVNRCEDCHGDHNTGSCKPAIEAERANICPAPAEHYMGWTGKYNGLQRQYDALAAKCRAMEAVVEAAVVWSDWMDNHVITTYVEQEHSLLERVDEYEAALAAADDSSGVVEPQGLDTEKEKG